MQRKPIVHHVLFLFSSGSSLGFGWGHLFLIIENCTYYWLVCMHMHSPQHMCGICGGQRKSMEVSSLFPSWCMRIKPRLLGLARVLAHFFDFVHFLLLWNMVVPSLPMLLNVKEEYMPCVHLKSVYTKSSIRLGMQPNWWGACLACTKSLIWSL